MSKKLDLSGKGKASNLEIEIASEDIIFILKNFDSPKDVVEAFMLAHYKMIIAAFPPKFKTEAIAAVKAQYNLIEALLNEGWL